MLCISDLSDPNSIKEMGDIIQEDKKNGAVKFSNGDWYYSANIFPSSCKNELIRILTERQKLKRIYDDSIKEIYELRNKISRGEIK